jgi:prepilin signal peptidase PulO-like enzyme (type II secretory pathway)
VQTQELIIIVFLALGLAMGSFGNVVLSRIPGGESLNGRSRCPKCGRVLGVQELIPVLSWLALRGKCCGCRKPISVQYPLIELAAAALFIFALMYEGYAIVPTLTLAIVLWSMLMIAVIDLRTSLIPDVLTITLTLSALAYHFFTSSLWFDLSGMVLGLAFLGVQWLGSRGKWVGSGDVFLAGALGLLAGSWVMVLVALFVSYIAGAVIAAVLLATKHLKKTSQVPFGPFLIFGTLVAVFWGERILNFMML